MPYILMFIVLFPFGYTARILWLHIFVNVNHVKGTWALTFTERVLRTETVIINLFNRQSDLQFCDLEVQRYVCGFDERNVVHAYLLGPEY